ncbi:uncharacterized protein LOC124161037 [Ischnura elegans]|uniref:uncharacterized protein LOC124161037 n=1 Tax=Ischnura elegans TaxID=197161 RepID=UPI001ED87371|nr:uncharacterized protein LOC124161037 [Ischnura elegans]XP_046393141.1 uncharacterized protein LOC124161037 [Ischnura elegans]
MNKHKGSVISGRISRPTRGNRAPSSAIFSRPSSSLTRSHPPRHQPSHASSRTSPTLLACRRSSSSVSTLSRRAVMKVLAVMESSSRGSCESGTNDSDDIVQDFLTSGRTGRRNALPDILGETANVTVSSASPLGSAAADLPSQLQKLTCQDSCKKDDGSDAGSGTSQETNPQHEGNPKRPDESKAEDSGGGRS